MLPYAMRAQEPEVTWQESFGGLDCRLGAGDGAIAAMENMTGDYWPVLSTRPERRLYEMLDAPHGLGGAEELFWVDGTAFYYGGEAKGSVAAGDKRFCCLGSYVVIWPDKLFYNRKTDQFGALEASVTAAGAGLSSARSPSGLSSRANCVRLPGCACAEKFAPNEAVRITGCEAVGEGMTLVIREIDGECLYFYDESFPLAVTPSYEITKRFSVGVYYFYDSASDGYYSFETETAISEGYRFVLDPSGSPLWLYRPDGEVQTSLTVETGIAAGAELLEMTPYYWPQTGTVTVSREVPALEHVCQCDNRLWGTYGNTVCCSYLGDPRVWYNFDQTATACWSVEVGAPGPFTAACSYGGYPLFFKEDHIYRVYGTKNANFQLFDTQTLGVERGSGKSPVVVGQKLYYKSRAGFVCYAGGVPRLIDAALGTARREAAVAGTDGRKYYVSCCENGRWSLLVYDSQNALWHREDASRALDFAWCGGELYMLRPDGGVWMVGRVRSGEGRGEGAFESVCTFAPMSAAGGSTDAVGRLYFRVSASGRLAVEVEYDGSGVWEKLTAIAGTKRRVQTVQLVPRRCGEFRLRLTGCGEWKLWAIGRERTAGSRMEG